MARVFLLSLVLAAVAVAISDASLERRERQLRSLYGGAGGGAGQPGQPGGLFGGGGGGGGGGGYFGGGAGGGAGQPGMPGGMYSDYDAAFTEEDLLSILAHAAKKPKPEIKTKVKIGPKCKDVSGVTDFIDGKHKKREWLTYLNKLIDDGNNECAADLSEQLLEQ